MITKDLITKNPASAGFLSLELFELVFVVIPVVELFVFVSEVDLTALDKSIGYVAGLHI